MVATRSSPRKKVMQPIDPESQADIEDDVEAAPEDVTIKIDESEVKGKDLAAADNNPPKLFILPKDASAEARIVTLPEPSSGAPSRYFACPEKGIYEFTTVKAPKGDLRSVLLAPEEHGESKLEALKGSIAKGYIAENADIFVATPVDPVFLLVPILAPASTKNKKLLFVPWDDHLDAANLTLRQLLRQERYKRMMDARLDSICDKVEAGDESMYRLSTDKLASVLVSKARRMVKHGLPASMEEKFIRQALQAPILSIKREDTIVSQTTTMVEEPDCQAGAADSQASSEVSTQKDSTFSQISATTSMTSISISQDPVEDALPDAPPLASEASEEVKDLLRLRTALTYITTCYIAPHITALLQPSFSTLIDFSTLDAHLKHLASLHEEARALRSLSDNITRKRGLDDDEAAEERAEKKRKKEEEEKKKKAMSNAAKQLKKVDTSGMKKMSSFFTKVPKKA